MLATADCELLGRQVGIAIATDEVEDTGEDLSVESNSTWEKMLKVVGACDFYSFS